LLSDRQGYQSRVADGPLEGWALDQLLGQFPDQMMGAMGSPPGRFPLLLKFLDANGLLSVQVHPSDGQTDYLPAGETGKTEAWVVLEAKPGSRIYAGLRPGSTRASLRAAISDGTVADQLVCFAPNARDAVFVPAGTVHTLGGGAVVFEISENSDVTLRLDDWGRVDAQTGQPRALQIDEAIDCIDFARGAPGTVVPVIEATAPVLRERLFDCEHFRLWRTGARSAFIVGAAGEARVLVSTEGAGQVEWGGHSYAVARGDVILLPAVVGACPFHPSTEVTLLEVGLPALATGPRSAEQ
jgi:mannose-6-phosphate isomerase